MGLAASFQASVLHSWLLSSSIVYCAASSAEVSAGVRGVAPADLPKYSSGSSFRCLNGEDPELPSAAINDDFCDCLDGSDEPGTSACAGQQQTHFYCPNEGSKPAYIYASRVNDGVCDCCDGSDEWSPPPLSTGLPREPCRNTCAKEGSDYKWEYARKEDVLRRGITKRRSMIESGRASREKERQELDRLAVQIPELEARETELREARNVANAKMEEEDAERKAAEEAAGKDAEAAAQSAQEPEAPATTTAAPVISEYAKWMEGSPDHAAAVGADGKEEKVVSEYAKWMDGADKAMKKDDDVDDEDRSFLMEVLWDVWKSVKKYFNTHWLVFQKLCWTVWQSLWGPSLTPTQRAARAAERAWKDASLALSKSKARIEELQKQVDNQESDDMLAYADLKDRCIKKKVNEYNYEVCFYKKAKQDSTTIGNWKHWEESHVALFDKGTYCHGGPHRSLRVRFECGYYEDILDIGEPSRCSYEATIAHPAACTDELLDAHRNQGPRMPHEEL